MRDFLRKSTARTNVFVKRPAESVQLRFPAEIRR